VETKNQEQYEQVGSMAGMGAGMLTGARVGSVLLPVPIVGTFAGALLGGVLGSAVGKRIGAAALSGVEAFLDTLSNPPDESGSARVEGDINKPEGDETV
jgi:outer membrane lipoprotein SlyB